MQLEDVYLHAYVKGPLNEVFKDVSSVPREYLMDWLKDTHDYQRQHTFDELERFLSFTPAEVLTWLEEASDFVWEANRTIRAVHD